MLRAYQSELIDTVRARWAAGAPVLAMQLATGGGKTVCIAELIRTHPGASAVIAHRNELVSQISQALAREGVEHDLICSRNEARAISKTHADVFGQVWYRPGARCAVISVDTMARRAGLEAWKQSVTLWIVDEGHHVLANNKWGKVLAGFTHPEVRGLLPTATPKRADGAGLGRHADGLADGMVRGPSAEWLMQQGYLTRYRVVAAPTHITEYLGDAGSSGDWSTAQLRAATQLSQIVGDLPASYAKHAPGRLGITFVSDVTTAKETAEAYVAAGIPAATMTGSTPDSVRRHIWGRFKARDILQVVAVDVISEGVDIPSLECVTFARPTASLAVMLQQLGRLLRPDYAPGFDLTTVDGRLAAMRASLKGDAPLLIDHAGNFLRHGGGPEMPRQWSLDRREKRQASTDSAAVRVCLSCAMPYSRVLHRCPFCGAVKPPPEQRRSPEAVEGDLTELDASVLQQLWARYERVMLSTDDERDRLVAAGCPPIGVARNVRRHIERQEAQMILRDMMAVIGGYWRELGHDDRTAQRLFWARYGLDVLSAQCLNATDTDALIARIDADLRDGVL